MNIWKFEDWIFLGFKKTYVNQSIPEFEFSRRELFSINFWNFLFLSVVDLNTLRRSNVQEVHEEKCLVRILARDWNQKRCGMVQRFISQDKDYVITQCNWLLDSMCMKMNWMIVNM